jgi:hypothetical protein
MNYFIKYPIPYWTELQDKTINTIKSEPYSNIQQCLKDAENIYNKGINNVQIVDESGDIYCEYEY